MKKEGIYFGIMVFVLFNGVMASVPVNNDFEFQSIDEMFVAMEKELPGFGGIFVDENEMLNIYLTISKKPEEVLPVIKKYFKQDIEKEVKGIKIAKAKYTFSQLYEWEQGLIGLLPSSAEEFKNKKLSVTMLDIDDKGNMITIGLEKIDEETRRMLEEKLTDLNIPKEVVSVIETGPIILDGHNQRYRPLKGGIQIQFSEGSSTVSCTLGFIADHLVHRRVAVTNGHCGNPGTQYYQNTYGVSGDLIGSGIANTDPPGPRWSDSLLIGISSGVSSQLGRIKRDIYDGIDAIISGKGYTQYVGDTVYKAGRSTHDTSGNIVNVCVHTSHPDYGTLYCQNYATYYATGGDSGSPVYRIINNPYSYLYGIHWGRFADGSKSIYSPIRNIENDQGILTVN